MADPTSAESNRSRRARTLARASVIALAAGIGGAAILAGGAWLLRRDIAREVATGWLERRGVDAELVVERLELDGFSGTLRAGPDGDPDLSVQRIEIDYGLNGFWNGRPFGASPTRVRLVRPVLKGRLTQKGLSLGSLDPIVEEFRRRPPRPDERGPRIEVENGAVRLATPYGLVQARGDAILDDGVLLSLDARVPAARLRGETLSADITGATVRVRKRGDRLHATVRAVATEIASTGLNTQNAVAALEAELPYPDLKRRRGDGRAVAALAVKADMLGAGGLSVRGAEGNLRFDGRTSGWVERFVVSGAAGGRLRGDRVEIAALDGREVRADLDLASLTLSRTEGRLAWRAAGGGEVRAVRARAGAAYLEAPRAVVRQADFSDGRDGATSGEFRAETTAGRVAIGDLAFTDARGVFDGTARFGAEPAGVQLRGALTSRGGGWSGLGPVRPGDVAELAAMKRAFGALRLDAPAVEIGAGSDRTVVSLEEPLVLAGEGGARITVGEIGETAIYDGGRGALTAVFSGGGLPEAELVLSDYRAGSGAGGLVFDAAARTRAQLDFAAARGIVLAADGRLRFADGALTFTEADCAQASAARLELGETDAERIAAELCATTAPLLTVGGGRWRVRADARRAQGLVPFLAARFEEGDLAVAADGGDGPPVLDADVRSARVLDTSEAPRFRPLRASGGFGLDRNDAWTGGLDLSPAGKETRLARVELRHEGASGRGQAVIDARGLRFAPGVLQPAEFTPLAELAGEPVSGAADFTGRFDWSPQGATSGGVFEAKGLDFLSPLGPLTGLSGRIEFESLAPLISAPDQRLRVASVQTVTVLTEAEVALRWNDTRIEVQGGGAKAGGGGVEIGRFDVPLTPEAVWRGSVTLDRVGLSEIVEASPFRDRVDLDASVSGPLPFVVGPDGFRIVDGRLRAVEPGRLSIQRAALTDLSAGGGATPATEGAAASGSIQDFAYQALENLAFDVLEAQVNSLPEGRLGVLFTVRGEHDPPVPERLNISWTDLLRRRFFDKPLPLPAGTEIDLTLDTTLNLDRLLADYKQLARDRAGRSEPVQP